MRPIDYLRGIKRRTRSIAAIVAIAVFGALLSTLVYPVRTSHPLHLAVAKVAQDQAANTSATAGKTGAVAQPQSPLTVIAAFVTIDKVTSRVAKDLSYKGSPANLASKVSATVDHTTGLLFITARASDPATALRRADAFATELINFVRDRDHQANQAKAQGLQTQIARLRGDIASYDRQLAKFPQALLAHPSAADKGTSSTPSSTDAARGSPADPLIAQRNAALVQLGTLSQQYQAIESLVPDAEGLSIFQSAQPAGTVKPRLPLPRSLPFRLLIALIVGALAGCAYSIMRDKFDRTIRTREAAEEAFEYPVLVEIPETVGKHRSSKRPDLKWLPPRIADGYRLLATSIGAGSNGSGGSAGGGGPSHTADGKQNHKGSVVVVTSAGPSEGKTTVVASLAGALSEVGKTVLLLSADFRRPSLHRQFGASNERGLAEVLRESNGGPVLNGLLWYTSLKGVWLLPSGNAEETADVLLASAAMRRAVMEARDRADVVIIDTSPVLTSDVAFLLPMVDSVLLVSKAGATRPELAARSSDLLHRLNAPVIGIVLIADTATALPRAYYGSSSLRHLIRHGPGHLFTKRRLPETDSNGSGGNSDDPAQRVPGRSATAG